MGLGTVDQAIPLPETVFSYCGRRKAPGSHLAEIKSDDGSRLAILDVILRSPHNTSLPSTGRVVCWGGLGHPLADHHEHPRKTGRGEAIPSDQPPSLFR